MHTTANNILAGQRDRRVNNVVPDASLMITGLSYRFGNPQKRVHIDNSGSSYQHFLQVAERPSVKQVAAEKPDAQMAEPSTVH